MFCGNSWKYGEMILETIQKKEVRKVKREVAYKQGYKIVIHGKFYEVSDVKRIFALWKSVSYTYNSRSME